MIYTFIAEHCSDLPVATCCRVLGVSTSGYYQRRNEPVTDAELADAYAANQVHTIWRRSRKSYGVPRVRKEGTAAGVGDIRSVVPMGATRKDVDHAEAVSERVP